MPLTKKGAKIMESMEEEYGHEKGKKVFYASKNKGTIKGVDKDMMHKMGKAMADKEMMKKHYGKGK